MVGMRLLKMKRSTGGVSSAKKEKKIEHFGDTIYIRQENIVSRQNSKWGE